MSCGDAAQQLREENKKRATIRFDAPRGQYVCNRGKVNYYQDDLKTPLCRGTLKSQVVDDAVWNCIKNVLQSPQLILDRLQQNADEQQAAVAVIQDRLDTADQHLAQFIGQRERLLNLFLDGHFPKDLLDEKMTDLKQTIKDLR